MLPKILSAAFVEGLLHGNLTSQEALSLGRKVQSTLATTPVSADDRPRDNVLQLPSANLCYRWSLLPCQLGMHLMQWLGAFDQCFWLTC